MARHGTGGLVASTLVLVATGGFVAYAATSVRGAVGGSRYAASFVSGEGLAPGTPVVLAGVPIGSVLSVALEPTTMTARVFLTVRSGFAIPTDSALAVTDGGPGGDVLELRPGSASTILPPGATITRTTPAVTLEEQVGDYIFGAGINGGSK